MVNKRIMGMPIALFMIGLLVIGSAAAAILSFYVNITGDTEMRQSVVWWDDGVPSIDTKAYSFAGTAFAGQTYESTFTVKNRANVPADVELVTSCSGALGGCAGVSWDFMAFNPVAVLNDDGSGSFGDVSTQVASSSLAAGTTLDDIFAGAGFSYTYSIANGGSLNGATPLVAVFELDDGQHVVLFPGYGVRTGTYTLTFSDTVAGDDGDNSYPVDFTVYASDFQGGAQWTNGGSYPAWTATKALAGYPLAGTEEVVRVFFMHQGAGTGQVDDLVSYDLMGDTIDGVTPITGPFTLGPEEVFSFAATFDFDVALAPDTFSIETQLQPR